MTRLHVICATRNRGERGTEKMTDAYMHALAAGGHEATLMLPHDALLAKKWRRERRDFFPLPDGWRWRAVLDPLFRRRVKKALHAADLIIVHNALLESDFRRLSNIPIVAVNHLDKTKRMARCDAVITLNSDMQRRLRDGDFARRRERVLLLPNGLWRTPAAAVTTATLKAPPTIGYLGALESFKGCFDLLLAAAQIKTPRLRLIFAGAGGAMEKLKQDAAALIHDVQFWGHVQDTNAFFSACDIFCLPSHAESFGLSLIEAMAHGLPSVATATKGAADIIENGNNGLLTPPCAPTELAQVLRILLNDDALRRRLGANARQTALARYAPPVFARHLSATVQAIVKLGRG